MLKKFFLNALSSFLGAWIALVLFGVVSVIVVLGLIGKLASSSDNNQNIKKGSVLVVNLEGEIIENELPLDIDYIGLIQGEISKKKALSEITKAIEAAAENKNVSGIYLKCGVCDASPATYNAIRNSLLKFKESGKPIIAYGNIIQMGCYYVATVADKIYLNPAGSVTLQGLGGINMFFKNLLDKIGIDVQVVKVGTYKSAVEPFISSTMSQPARAQLDTLYGNMWKLIREGISQQREDVTPGEIDTWVSEDFIFLKEAPFAMNKGLIDGIYYERSMDSIIASTIHKDKDDLNFISTESLIPVQQMELSYSQPEQIVVLYASGEIVDGGAASTINYQALVPVITDLAENKKVKGMVLRVNSPGGSAFGSEQIGEALDFFMSKGKPLAVSMGDYAASGGYWISSGANIIFADPLTITGSIGIFGLIPNAEKLMDKIGVNSEIVSTNPEAEFPNLLKPLNPRQLAAMQETVSAGYDKFVARVAKGRHLSEATVRRIGEGRVWDAVTAKKIGLVDSLGGLQDAIDWVAKEIGNDNYSVSYYPRKDNSMWSFLPESFYTQLKENMRMTFGESLPERFYYKIYNLINQNPVQAKMPELKIIL